MIPKQNAESMRRVIFAECFAGDYEGATRPSQVKGDTLALYIFQECGSAEGEPNPVGTMLRYLARAQADLIACALALRKAYGREEVLGLDFEAVRSLLHTLAAKTKDGEPLPSGEPFDMPNDDAVETLHTAISAARSILGIEDPS